jgi:hypothetical protein
VAVESYRVLISIEVLQLERPSRGDRDLMLSFLASLEKDPSRRGDYEELDEVGRPVQIKVLGKIAITYWTDHAVKEIKVTKVEKADVH